LIRERIPGRLIGLSHSLTYKKGGKTMSYTRALRTLCAACITFMLVASSVVALAQSAEVEGLIKTRSGETLGLQLKDNTSVTVQLNDATDVGQVQGMLKARHKEMSMAALIPGLPIKVKGVYDSQNILVAQTIRFKGNDLEQAKAIQAGMHETNAKVGQNTQDIQANKDELAKQNAAIQEAVARFGQLDDYYIFDEVTVYFDNGKTNIDPKYVPQLQALAQKAQDIQGYMVEVKGYASAVGNAAKNQALSEDRADNVTNMLLQQCKVPLTRMLAPGAMGETEQVGDNKTEEGQSENRRVVVRVLQNKAIASAPAKAS
jgi:outer membrane protein OmpA-like peptidoglycan-associated protein